MTKCLNISLNGVGVCARACVCMCDNSVTSQVPRALGRPQDCEWFVLL